jgi:hypothetical protein
MNRSRKVIHDQEVDRPVLATLANKQALELAPSQRTLTVRSSPVAGEYISHWSTVTERRDSNRIPSSRSHRCIGRNETYGRRSIAKDKLVNEQLDGKEHCDLSSRRRIDEVDAATPKDCEINQGKRYFVDPAKIDPARPTVILKDQATIASDANEAGSLLRFQKLLVPGPHGDRTVLPSDGRSGS